MFSLIARDARELIHYAATCYFSPWKIIPVPLFCALVHRPFSRLYLTRASQLACEAETGQVLRLSGGIPFFKKP